MGGGVEGFLGCSITLGKKAVFLHHKGGKEESAKKTLISFREGNDAGKKRSD